MTKNKKLLIVGAVIVIISLVVVGVGMLFAKECYSDSGFTASSYKTCTCQGYEIVLFNDTAVDGGKGSICFGTAVIKEHTRPE